MAMTIKQKQWQLFYLGYYGDSINDIDGVWGKNSIAATKKFKQDFELEDNGIFDSIAEDKSKDIIKNIQKKLTGLVVDGLAGNKTKQATANYQKLNGLTVTGRIDSDTREKLGIKIAENNVPSTTINTENTVAVFWSKIKYFDRNEFACKCGGRYCKGFPTEPKKLLVEEADIVREHFGLPMIISSGIRCKRHNANVGGVANSRHMSGKAIDFTIRGKSAAEVLAFVKTRKNIRYCYAIDSEYVHMDIL